MSDETPAADDAVRRFRETFHAAAEGIAVPEWGRLQERQKESWRARYRAARDFFGGTL